MCVSQDCGGLSTAFLPDDHEAQWARYPSQQTIVFILGNKDIMQSQCPQTSGVTALSPPSADPVTSYFIETWEAFGPPD